MDWQRLRHFHKEPRIIEGWLAAFGPLLAWLTPGRRRVLLSLGGLWVAAKIASRNADRAGDALGTELGLAGTLALIALLLGFALACFALARHFATLPSVIRRHPQIALHSVFWVLVFAAWIWVPRGGPGAALLAACIFALPFLLWRIGYMVLSAQRGKLAGARLTDHAFYLFPVWGGSDTPYGKGHDYLSAHEAKDPAALARSQLAGIKLFILAGLWSAAKELMSGLVYGEDNAVSRAFGGASLGVPRLGAMLASPDSYPVWLAWAALYLGLVWAVLTLAASGHLVIGWLRFAGFNVFRNTYKPLLAETVVEFWNRYYYYFKELLVNFFFFPTFTRYFKAYPRLRIFAAVFAAAFLGNMYYHWIRLDAPLAAGDFAAMWAALQSRLFYCLLLALGIYVSMRREQARTGPRPERGPARRAIAIFGVWTFFSIIHIWAEEDPAPFAARLAFALGLIGLG